MEKTAQQYDIHFPVMLPQVLEALSPADGEVYVDGTFGAGGYSAAILDAADCIVYAIDRDPSAVERALALKERYGERFIFLRGCFGDVVDLLAQAGAGRVDGFVLDIGVSSMQLDEAERGFSFRYDAPLDMRMDTSAGITAADIVNGYEQDDLANLIYVYGEERLSRRIARKIVQMRSQKPFETTLELADAVRAVVPKSGKVDPATRTFQALRIAVNDELGELTRALDASVSVLREGGRLVVVSFHSLEDGLVKSFLKAQSGEGEAVSRYMPDVGQKTNAYFETLSRKAVKPSDEEIAQNPRSRSARLRGARRTAEGVV